MTDETLQRRLQYILPPHARSNRKLRDTELSHLVVVLGSGGHTREMQSILKDIDPHRYRHRTYVISSGDDFSARRVKDCEKLIQSKYNSTTRLSGHTSTVELDLDRLQEPSPIGSLNNSTGLWDVKVVGRARQIFQPLYTTPFSSVRCLFHCVQILLGTKRLSIATPNQFPDVIITNGPGTGFIMVLASVMLKLIAIAPVEKMKVVFVESWARPYKLSLTGRLLLEMGFCDRFIVQWKEQAASINQKSHGRKVEFMDFMVGSDKAPT